MESVTCTEWSDGSSLELPHGKAAGPRVEHCLALAGMMGAGGKSAGMVRPALTGVFTGPGDRKLRAKN